MLRLTRLMHAGHKLAKNQLVGDRGEMPGRLIVKQERSDVRERTTLVAMFWPTSGDRLTMYDVTLVDWSSEHVRLEGHEVVKSKLDQDHLVLQAWHVELANPRAVPNAEYLWQQTHERLTFLQSRLAAAGICEADLPVPT